MAIGLLVGAVVAVDATTPVVASPSENVATRWVARALGAVRSDSPAVHTGTPGAARTYAMTTSAMYDAVNGIDVADGVSTRDRAIVASYQAAPAGANRDSAASAAAHAVLRTLFADNVAQRDALDTAHAAELAALGSAADVEAGRSWGEAVGGEVVAARALDGTHVAKPAQPGGAGPGVFPRPFNGVQFADMAPFGVASPMPYASAGPPDLTSTEYAAAFDDVRLLGSSTDRNPERAAIARHWLAEAGTVRETGLWFKVALQVAQSRGTVASLSDTVRVFALLGMGIADSVTVSWIDKARWHYWRPGDAIRQASTDGNMATAEDRAWSPRNGVCASTDVRTYAVFGGTPEHTSGTSTFAGAAATILASFYCTDQVPFTFSGEQPGSVPRSYTGFAQAAREAGRSRIYGGIHFQFSNDAGREAGRDVAHEIVRSRLLPSGDQPQGMCIG